MNWLVIVVFVILIASAFCGYRKGFLRMAYSLVAWIVIFVFVSWSTPYIADYLTEHTAIPEKIAEKCEERLQAAAEEKIQQEGQNAQSEALDSLGLNLPSALLEKMQQYAGGAAADVVAHSGIYSEIAEVLAEYAVRAIAGVTAFVVAVIFSAVIGQALGLISKIPIIHGVNQGIGLVAGVLYGMILIWIGMCLLALCGGSETGKLLYSYVQENAILLYIYDNNPIIRFFF